MTFGVIWSAFGQARKAQQKSIRKAQEKSEGISTQQIHSLKDSIRPTQCHLANLAFPGMQIQENERNQTFLAGERSDAHML